MREQQDWVDSARAAAVDRGRRAAANALTAAGFVVIATGGGCSAWVRDDGQIEECITLVAEAVAPTYLDDDCHVSTREVGGDWGAPETATLGRIVAALADEREEYLLLMLRLANGYGE